MTDVIVRRTHVARILLASAIALSAPPLIGSPTLAAAEKVDRRQAPDFTLRDANGKAFQLSAQRGKVVLVDFWATWCTGCNVEIPWYVEFHKKYQTRGLALVGVAMDEEGWEKVRPYLAEHPITYPVVIGNLDLLQKTFGLDPSLPVTLLIDRQGRIAESHVGVVVKDEWESKVLALLKEK